MRGFLNSPLAAACFSALIAGVLYFSGLLAFFALVPLAVAYYVKGPKVFISSSLLFLLAVVAVRLIMNSFAPNSADETAAGSLSQNGMGIAQGGQQNVQQNVQSAERSAFIYEIFYAASGVLAVFILLRSSAAWVPRLLLASLFPFTSAYLQVRYLQENMGQLLSPTSSFSHILGKMNNANAAALSPEDVQNLIASAMLFMWAVTLFVLLFNWIVAVFITRRILRFNLHQYLRYVYGRVAQYSSARLPLLLAVCAVLFLALRGSTDGTAFHIKIVSANIAIALLFCYLLYGVCQGYFLAARISKKSVEQYLQNRAARGESASVPAGFTAELRGDLYFLMVCIILLIPGINIAAGIAVIVFGFLRHMQAIRGEFRKQHTNTEKPEEQS